MAPKTKSKSKAAALPQQPKTLSSRVRQVVVQQQEVDEADEQQELVVPVQMAFTSLISTTWNLRHTSAFCMIDSYATTSPIWRDSFCVSLEPGWMEPPLHKYLRSEDAELPAERLLVQFWRESRFRERLQLGHKLLHEVGDITGAAMLLFDVAPSPRGAQDWVTRIQLACAAYKHAWHLRADDSMASQALQEGQLTLQEARWMRAQWLLARTLCAALFNSSRRTAGLLSMVVSALIAVMPEDPMGSRFMVQRSLGGCSAWDNLAEITKPYLTPAQRPQDLTPNPFGADAATMATVYNRALACYQRYGPSDPRSVAALAAAFERDPSRWVPLLLSGGALAVPGRPPLVALGSKEEAAAYCSEYGSCWWVGSLSTDALGALVQQDLEQAEAVEWLAEKAGLTELAGLDLDLFHAGVMFFNIGMINNSMTCCLPVVVDEMNVRINGSMSIGTAGSTKPEECPGIARSCLALLCCLGASTQGLPPLGTCDIRLWAPIGNTMAISTGREGAAASLKTRLSDSAISVFDIAHRVVAQCRLWQQQEKRGELQGRLGLLWPSELLHWERTLEELRPARARLLWQAGLVRTAKEVAAELLEHQEQLHAKLQSQLSSSSSDTARDAALASLLRGTLAAPGPVLCSLTSVREMQELLNQQAVEAARRTLSSRTRGGGARGGSSSRGGSGAAAEVQYQRYEEATPDALRRFAAAVLDAVGGEASINEALDLAQLRQACGRARRDSSESDDDDRILFAADSSSAEVAVSVIHQLLSSPMPPPAAAALGGVHRGQTARQQQQQQQQRDAASSVSSSRKVPGIVSALRACLSGNAAPWVGAMGAVLPDSSGHSHCCCCPHHGMNPQAAAAFREALADPDIIKAAVSSILTSRGMMNADNAPEMEDVISAMMEQLPSMMAAGEDDSSSSGGGDDDIDGSSRGAQESRAVKQQGTSTQRTAGAAAGVGQHSAALGHQVGAAVSSGGQASAGGVSAAAAGGFGVRSAPMFVFGSSPEAASATATAAFDAVLQSYTPTAQGAAQGAAACVFAGNSPVGIATPAAPPPAAAVGSTGAGAGSSASPAAAAGGDEAASGPRVCACCGGSFAKVYRCSRCAAAGLVVGYCSAACQKAHWNAGHKSVCGKPQR